MLQHLPGGTKFGRMHLQALAEMLNAELIDADHLVSLLESGATIHAYIGYETQGRLHPGSMVGLGILRYLNQFHNVKTTVFLADLHTRLNLKTPDPTFPDAINRLRSQLFPRPQAFHIVRGLRDLHDRDYFLNFLATHTDYTLARATRGARQNARSEVLKVSDLLYACMQAFDLDALQIDLALGATDQRNKHMMHRDNRLSKRRSTYMHFPLLVTGKGQKLSKSRGHGFSDLDPHSQGAKVLSELWGDLGRLQSVTSPT